MRKYVPYLIIVFAILLNVIARLSVSFCDSYVTYIFPAIVEVFGRLTSIFAFSVGEIMLYAAFIMLVLLLIGGFIYLFRKKMGKKDGRFLKIYQMYAQTCLWLTAIFSFIMTTNCFILYHCSAIHTFYAIGSGENQTREYGLAEISRLRDFVVEEANKLATELARDEQDYLIYEGDMALAAQLEMKRLGREYSRLAGYYPHPKPMLLSNFFSQQYIMGYYFPFSMEANYNTTMYITNVLPTICHELAHVKGFIYEDEANFLAFLACVDSDDPLFRYSGYLSVLYFLERDFIAALGNETEVYYEHPQISDLVRRDDIFLTPEAWEQVEKTAIFSTDFVRDISNEIVEVNLILNGVSDGALSYGRVVELLLMHYDGVLI